MKTAKDELAEKFKFLDKQIANEAFVYEILNEISLYQEHYINSERDRLATIDELNNSRNIKIPFNSTREKNIIYLIELIRKNHPEKIKTVTSFEFNIEQDTKKLSIVEKTEYTVMIDDNNFQDIEKDRVSKTIDSLLNLLGKFRLFNLTKLVNRSKQKKYLHDLIMTEVGKSIFTFKNYSVDKDGFEAVEIYCFHKKNFESVKKKLNVDDLKKVIKDHVEPIKRRLKKFGIINYDFTDYRDSKLDYILNILLKDITSSMNKRELVDVKNFNSLRTCMIDIGKNIDPIISISSDIVKYIKENGICKESELTSIFEALTKESLEQWLKNNMETHKVFSYSDGASETIYLESKIYLDKLMELHKLIFQQKEKFSSLSGEKKRDYLSLCDMLCRVGKDILKSEDKIKIILGNETNINKLKQVLADYDSFKKMAGETKKEETAIVTEPEHYVKKKSLFRIIIDFIKSIFGKKKAPVKKETVSKPASIKSRSSFSKDTRDIYNKIKTINESLIPISDYIEIIPENEKLIDKVIAELQGNNLKIIIPVYGARSALYPKRSSKLLISDAEYLLIEPTIIHDTDSIREFIDSLAGYRVKNETLSIAAIGIIEKFLLTIHRKNRAKLKRKK